MARAVYGAKAAQFTEKIQVNYTRLAVPGLSHQPLQFQNTGNRQISGVEF